MHPRFLERSAPLLARLLKEKAKRIVSWLSGYRKLSGASVYFVLILCPKQYVQQTELFFAAIILPINS